MRCLLFLLLMALPGQAACLGPNAFDALPADTRANLQDETAQSPYGQGILWQAEKPGSMVHVVGTLHFPDPRHTATLDMIRPMLAEADQLLIEVRQQDQKTLEHRIATEPGLAFISEGPTLIDRLTAAEWDQIKAELRLRGVPAFMAAKYQPWFLGMTLAIPPCALEDIWAKKRGLDQMIEAEAMQMGLPVSSLDDLDSLLEMLAGDPMDQQIADLKLGLRLGLFGQDMTTTTVDLYFREEVGMIWPFTRHHALSQSAGHAEQVDALIDEMAQELLDDRNNRWAPQILKAAENRRIVIAVGALHLGRDSGVLQTLAEAGYTLTRLPIPR